MNHYPSPYITIISGYMTMIFTFNHHISPKSSSPYITITPFLRPNCVTSSSWQQLLQVVDGQRNGPGHVVASALLRQLRGRQPAGVAAVHGATQGHQELQQPPTEAVKPWVSSGEVMGIMGKTRGFIWFTRGFMGSLGVNYQAITRLASWWGLLVGDFRWLTMVSSELPGDNNSIVSNCNLGVRSCGVQLVHGAQENAFEFKMQSLI